MTRLWNLLIIGMAASIIEVFAWKTAHPVRRTPLIGFSNKIGSPARIDLYTRDVPLTSELSDRVHSKIGKIIDKLGHDVVSTHITLKKVHHVQFMHHPVIRADENIAEANIVLKGGSMVVASENTNHMFTSIDQLTHKVARSLKRHNEKTRQSMHSKESLSSIDTIELPSLSESTEDIREDDSALDDLYQSQLEVSTSSMTTSFLLTALPL